MDSDQSLPIAEGWLVYRLPRSHWHCQVSNFDFVAVTPDHLSDYVKGFSQQAVAGGAPHLFLTGPPGCGKTHLGIGIYRTISITLGTGVTTWINVPMFCEAAKRSYGGKEWADPWEDVEAAKRLVVLDDLFGRELSQHESSQFVYRLIDTCYQNRAALVVTMNQDVEDLEQHVVPHEISRLLADATVIRMKAQKDWRRRW